MRNLLLATLVTSTAALPAPADACGPYESQPQAFLVMSPGVAGRTFVLLGGGIPATAQLTPLSPQSYDSTAIGDAPDLAAPMTFTLLGPNGTEIVESAARVWLAPAWEGAKGAALEVTADRETQIALAGRHDDATWIALDHRDTTASDRRWVVAQGVSLEEKRYIAVSRVHGSRLDILSTYSDGKPITLVRSDGVRRRRLAGTPLGVVTLDDERFLVTMRDGRAITTKL